MSTSPSLALLSFLYTGFTQKLSQKYGESVHQGFRLTFYQLSSFRERISFTKILVNILILNVMNLAWGQELTSSPRDCKPQLYQHMGEQELGDSLKVHHGTVTKLTVRGSGTLMSSTLLQARTLMHPEPF